MSRILPESTGPDAPDAKQRRAPSSLPERNAAIDALRGFVTLLVVAHHALLAYHPYAPAPGAFADGRDWAAFPVIDRGRSSLWAPLVTFNDAFFMSLLFFVSGLFVWDSLQRKGRLRFLRDRALRLGVPFVVVAAVLAPVAYYPAYLTRTASPGFGDFWSQWTSLGVWPAGPAWFLWVLLAYGSAFAAVRPAWRSKFQGWIERVGDRPAAIFCFLVVLSWLVYAPLVLAFGPAHWTAFGPFAVQTSRVLHYAAYFTAGAIVGAAGTGTGVLAPDGRLARRWPGWCASALAAFLVLDVFEAVPHEQRSFAQQVQASLAFVLSCATSSFAVLALFLRWARRPGVAVRSWARNAYGVYLTHYVFVTWLQLLLLNAAFGAIAKGVLVTAGAAVLAWITTAALRRIPAVARII